MFSAFASLPAAYLSWRLEGRADLTAAFCQTGIQVAGVFIFLAITLSLKKLLNSKFNFHDSDRFIAWMIKANLLAGILTVLGLFSSQFKDTFGLAALLIVIVQGVVQVLFGYRLLRLNNNLGGMLKPFCFANILTGICIASVVLILVGIFISALADLMLGTIFLNLARLETAEDKGGQGI